MTHQHTFRALCTNAHRLTLLTCAAVCFASVASCNILGPAYVVIAGPEKAAAEFKPDPAKRTVVFVDDRASVLPRRSLRQIIAQRVERTLLDEGLVKNVIDSSGILAASLRETYDKPLEITTLGASVGADVVVYISMDRFGLSPDGQTFQPYAEGRVKVLEIAKEPDARVWPQDAKGYTVRLDLPVGRSSVPSSSGLAVKAQESLADRFGDRVGKLFYKHPVRESVSETR